MNEEEKKAIEELKEFIKGPCEICRYCSGAYRLNRKNIIQLLNLIEKLQKENEELKLYNNSITSELEQMTTEKFKNDWFHQSEFKGLILPKKVKDKIEYYQKLQDNYIEKCDEANEGLQAMISALQKLLEGK